MAPSASIPREPANHSRIQRRSFALAVSAEAALATITRISPKGCYAYAPLNDDISPSAGDYSLELRLLGLGHCELVKGLLKIVDKGLPLCRARQSARRSGGRWFPAGQGAAAARRALPFAIHHTNLTQSGIYQIQNAILGALAKDKVWLSCTIILPLRAQGDAGSPVRPVAISAPSQ